MHQDYAGRVVLVFGAAGQSRCLAKSARHRPQLPLPDEPVLGLHQRRGHPGLTYVWPTRDSSDDAGEADPDVGEALPVWRHAAL